MITIDPNLRGCGVALWKNGALVRAEYVKNPAPVGRGYGVYAMLADQVFWKTYIPGELLLVVEMPRAYGSVHEKGDPNDLLDVMAVGAAVVARFQAVAVPT